MHLNVLAESGGYLQRSLRENALLAFVKEISIKKKVEGIRKIFNPPVVVYRYENNIGDLNPTSKRKHSKCYEVISST